MTVTVAAPGERAEARRPPRLRLFVAAEIDEPARAACADVAQRLRAKGFAAKWVLPENYHLTVAFIGGVEEARVESVRAAVRDAAARASPLNASSCTPDLTTAAGRTTSAPAGATSSDTRNNSRSSTHRLCPPPARPSAMGPRS